ncbi:MAG: condensation domain-containing protein, partial [Candidatus Binatia bacterium]
MAGRLDVKALQKSLDAIVARHEALRTTFAAASGIPMQVICGKRSIEVGIIDLSEWPVPDRELELTRLLNQRAVLPFNLGSDLMLRATLIRLADEEHALLLVMHHIASDGWSIANLCRELAIFYDAFSSGSPSPLPNLDIQYADFAAWEREWLRQEILDEKISYWKRQLAGISPLVQLPADRPRPALLSSRGSQQTFTLSKELTESLQALGHPQGATLFMTLLAAFNVLLCGYTKQYDLVVGTPIAGRNRTELEGLIGFFINALLLRTDLSGDPTIRELLERVREITLAAYTHEMPITKLVEALRPERSLSHRSLSQVSFGLQNNPAQAMELSGLTLTPLEVRTEATKTDLTLVMVEREEQLTGRLEYSTDLFDASTIE